MSRLLMIAVVLAIPCVSQAQDDQPPQTEVKASDPSDAVRLEPKGKALKPSVWMQQKLLLSQKIFAGLTEGDLIKAQEAARTMSLLNKLESFVRRRSPAYRNQLRMFQFANKEIVDGSADGNLERATLAYTQLSISCISCHKQLRRTQP